MTFEFIVDDKLRDGLVADHRELVTSLEGGCWKAAMVLAGSIIEAILTDALLVSPPSGKTDKNPLSQDLSSLIVRCVQLGLVSERTAQLASVVRNYRNLIHPGRLARLAEACDEPSARVAESLVKIIAAEVAAKQQNTVGLNAEQLATKLETDDSAMPLVPHLLSEMAEAERIKLVLRVLPERYAKVSRANTFALEEDFTKDHTLEAFRRCYRLAIGLLPDSFRTKSAASFVQLLRTGNRESVRAYGDAFFCAGDLQYVDAAASPMVRQYLIGRIGEGSFDLDLEAVCSGLGPVLTGAELTRWSAAYAKWMTNTAVAESVSGRARRSYLKEVMLMGKAERSLAVEALDRLARILDVQDSAREAEMLREIKAELAVAIAADSDAA